MKRIWMLLVLIGFSLPVLAAESAEESALEDTDAIVALYAKWRLAVETADIPAYVSVLSEDVKLMPPDADAIIGKQGYGAFLEPVFAAATYTIEVPVHPEVIVMEDIAVAEYEYVIHLDMKAGAEISEPGAITVARSHNRYFDVLKRINGEWLIWRHLWRTIE